MGNPKSTVAVTQDHIVRGLKELGIVPGDVVMVHSSLSSMGYVGGGADTVIDAFLEAVGPDGTLVMPALCRADKERRFETWNIATSPSDVGRITETFRLRPGSVRSDHATHSVAAMGPLTGEITRGHKHARGRPGPWGDAAFAKDSAWQKLYDLNARYTFLGVNLRVNTMRHFIQSVLVERALTRAPADRRETLTAEVKGWCTGGVWPDYSAVEMQEHHERAGLIHRTTIGSAEVLMLHAREMVDEEIRVFEARPEDWFDEAFLAWYRECDSTTRR
ncbi:MAG: AAC(3) family N-acetyltransferase [Planctomycetes bacterium]|nr:AAC(3) family N-acetyltransferase [Planctomycetota bacterium]